MGFKNVLGTLNLRPMNIVLSRRLTTHRYTSSIAFNFVEDDLLAIVDVSLVFLAVTDGAYDSGGVDVAV